MLRALTPSLTLVLFVAAAAASASASAASICRGVVLDRDGKPIAGALVVVERAPARRASTDRDGRFALADAQGGDIALIVSYAGPPIATAVGAASIRMRYFGPRQLDQAGAAYSSPSPIFNSQYTIKLDHRRRITLDILNVQRAS